MARRFFYVSLGALAVAIAWNLVAMSVRADWDPSGLDVVAGGERGSWYTSSGEAWHLNNYIGVWTR